jgi:hypothetical protein
MRERNDMSDADLSEDDIITGNGDEGQNRTVPDSAPMFICQAFRLHGGESADLQWQVFVVREVLREPQVVQGA